MADDKRAGPSAGRYVTGGLFPGPHGLVAGKVGHKWRTGGREFGESLAGGIVGGAAGAATRSPRAANALLFAGSKGGAVHAVHDNERLNRYKPDKGKKVVASKAIQHMGATNVRSVAVAVPTGRHVSHANDLVHIRNSSGQDGHPVALKRYRRGKGQSAMPARVGKAFNDPAPMQGSRGTPMSDVATQSRHGRRLVSAPLPFDSVAKAERGDWNSLHNATTRPGGRNAFYAGSVGGAKRVSRGERRGEKMFANATTHSSQAFNAGSVGTASAKKAPGRIARFLRSTPVKRFGRWN